MKTSDILAKFVFIINLLHTKVTSVVVILNNELYNSNTRNIRYEKYFIFNF